MDRCLSWKGVCIEANAKYYESIHRERSCALIPTCVSDKDGVSVEFALSGPGSGVVSTHRQGKAIQERAGAVVKKKCVSIMPQLERYGVKEVDYFNLDVEGHELTVLKSFDFDKVKVKVISIELPTSRSAKDEIRELLAKNGFVKHDNEEPSDGVEGMPIYPGNEFYLHPDVVWGHPE
ncbi:S-adenosyl-L-methionine-dependent methyltransferase [Gracilaria domingensis]|nr:S-adenosyl-L-methionine-dependent methyltransferase [Gracilaria domingensis]